MNICAPSNKSELFNNFDIENNEVNGGQNIILDLCPSEAVSFTLLIKEIDSSIVLFIFQFPAIIGLIII